MNASVQTSFEQNKALQQMTEVQLRNNASKLVREIREMWPGLIGGWTRREWNAQARSAGRRYIENTRKFLRANE